MVATSPSIQSLIIPVLARLDLTGPAACGASAARLVRGVFAHLRPAALRSPEFPLKKDSGALASTDGADPLDRTRGRSGRQGRACVLDNWARADYILANRQGSATRHDPESARVENFKCIDDSTEFSIRSLTALVGKNESGKTALLKALYRVNPILPVDGDFSSTEYPVGAGGVPPAHGLGARPRRYGHLAPRGAGSRGGGRPLGPACFRANSRRRDPWLRQPPPVAFDVDERRVVSNLVRRAKLDSGRVAQPVVRDDRRGAGPGPPIASTRPRRADGACSRTTRSAPGGSLTSRWSRSRDNGCPGSWISPIPPAAGRGAIDELMRRKSRERAHGRRHDLPRAARARQYVAGGPAGIDQFDVPRRGARSGLAPHHPRSHGILEPGPLPRSRLPLRRRAAARCATAQHRLHPAHAHPQPAPQRDAGFDERSAGFIWFFSFLVWLSHIRRDMSYRLHHPARRAGPRPARARADGHDAVHPRAAAARLPGGLHDALAVHDRPGAPRRPAHRRRLVGGRHRARDEGRRPGPEHERRHAVPDPRGAGLRRRAARASPGRRRCWSTGRATCST